MTRAALFLSAAFCPVLALAQNTPEPPPHMTPQQLASQIPGRDLGANPPRVESNTFTLLAAPQPQGNALLHIRFRPTDPMPPKLAMATDLGQTWLRNDGLYPDISPSDGVHTALVPLQVAQLIARRAKAERLRLVNNNGFAMISPFDGRRKLARRPVRIPGAADLVPGVPILGGGGGMPEMINAGMHLMVTGSGVIGDLTRTFKPCPVPTGNPDGKWTFKYLVQQMANTPVTGVTAETLVRKWIDKFRADQVVNGLKAPKRKNLTTEILNRWIADSGGENAPLNLDLAPFELIAIVNRTDLRGNTSFGGGKAGELRFIFAAFDLATCSPAAFNVIFEYGVPRIGCSAVKSWAQQWADLPNLALAYNAALEALTEQVVVSGVTEKFGGSALNQLRTNERVEFPVVSAQDWEMREYALANTNAGIRLLARHLNRTPDTTYRTSPPDKLLMRDFINNTETGILNDNYQIGATYPLMPLKRFGAGSANAFPIFFVWDTPGVTNGEARHRFALNTCNGRHTDQETETQFQHVRAGSPVQLSPFLTGTSVTDPVDGVTVREFNDLERRAADLEELIDTPCVVSAVNAFAPAVH